MTSCPTFKILFSFLTAEEDRKLSLVTTLNCVIELQLAQHREDGLGFDGVAKSEIGRGHILPGRNTTDDVLCYT